MTYHPSNPAYGQSVRRKILEEGFALKRSLIQTAGDALGPTADAHVLTASEEEQAWQLPDAQQVNQRDQIWIEELRSAKQRFPDLLPDELVEEARPHVGVRLYPYRARVVDSGGRIDIRDQVKYAENLSARVRAKTGDQGPAPNVLPAGPSSPLPAPSAPSAPVAGPAVAGPSPEGSY